MIVDARQPQRWGPVLRGIGSSYPQAAPEGWRNGAPVILFSRYPILHQEVVEPPGGRRPYLIAELSVEGQPLTFVAVHPSSPSPTEARDSRARNRALDDIAEVVRATDGPVIVAGDFNISPWSPHYRDLLATAGLRDAAGAGQSRPGRPGGGRRRSRSTTSSSRARSPPSTWRAVRPRAPTTTRSSPTSAWAPPQRPGPSTDGGCATTFHRPYKVVTDAGS